MPSVVDLIKSSKRLTRNLWVDIRVSKAPEGTRLVVVTPRKSGNAVKRNQFKRRIKALFRELGLAKFGYSWIFFAKKDVASCSFTTLRLLLEEAARKLSEQHSSH
ncbi:TPA: hypothetical protein DDZ86_04065 [Candidatus Dependentiae bacterium]|nr:MAG: Ribonuclease P protein component [candidate division TM6 bacterium GW2011_GWF2_43_87]HBL98790.1 hypothetical protein [Candidatus Dependentiae bacterium]